VHGIPGDADDVRPKIGEDGGQVIRVEPEIEDPNLVPILAGASAQVLECQRLGNGTQVAVSDDLTSEIRIN
jgi:hypothetical protein